MTTQPIYERTASDHGFAPIHRGLGAVRVLRHDVLSQRCADTGASETLCSHCAGQEPELTDRDQPGEASPGGAVADAVGGGGLVLVPHVGREWVDEEEGALVDLDGLLTVESRAAGARDPLDGSRFDRVHGGCGA